MLGTIYSSKWIGKRLTELVVSLLLFSLQNLSAQIQYSQNTEPGTQNVDTEFQEKPSSTRMRNRNGFLLPPREEGKSHVSPPPFSCTSSSRQSDGTLVFYCNLNQHNFIISQLDRSEVQQTHTFSLLQVPQS